MAGNATTERAPSKVAPLFSKGFDINIRRETFEGTLRASITVGPEGPAGQRMSFGGSLYIELKVKGILASEEVSFDYGRYVESWDRSPEVVRALYSECPQAAFYTMLRGLGRAIYGAELTPENVPKRENIVLLMHAFEQFALSARGSLGGRAPSITGDVVEH